MQGCPKAELVATFEFVMKLFASEEKCNFYWKSFLIVLLKLFLYLGFQDITYRINISKSTVSRRFHEALDIMAIRHQGLIHWPKRDQLWKTMPMCFRTVYGTMVVAMVNCYEIKIEKPSHLVTKAATWSQTFKYCDFHCHNSTRHNQFHISSFGGRVSDNHMTVCSGFLQKLLLVMTTGGFTLLKT